MHGVERGKRRRFYTNPYLSLSELLNNGADLCSVQDLLGHSDISITRKYVHVSYSRKKEVLLKYNTRNFLF